MSALFIYSGAFRCLSIAAHRCTLLMFYFFVSIESDTKVIYNEKTIPRSCRCDAYCIASVFLSHFMPNIYIQGLDLRQIEVLREKAFSLKKGFQKTEQRPWLASTVAAELVLQTTHLAYALADEDIRPHIFPSEGVDKGLSDELSDVLFNIFTLFSFLGLSIYALEAAFSEFGVRAQVITQDAPTYTIALNMTIQAGVVLDAVMRLDDFKHKDRPDEDIRTCITRGLAGMFLILLHIAARNGIDIYTAFSQMLEEAELFLRNYTQYI